MSGPHWEFDGSSLRRYKRLNVQEACYLFAAYCRLRELDEGMLVCREQGVELRLRYLRAHTVLRFEHALVITVVKLQPYPDRMVWVDGLIDVLVHASFINLVEIEDTVAFEGYRQMYLKDSELVRLATGNNSLFISRWGKERFSDPWASTWEVPQKRP